MGCWVIESTFSTLLRNCQMFSRSNCVNLHLHKQCSRVLLPQSSCQDLYGQSLSSSLIIYVWWYLFFLRAVLKNLFIYLFFWALLSLGCSMWAICVGSVVAAHRPSCCMWGLVPWSEIKPMPTAFECRILATGSLGKSHVVISNCGNNYILLMNDIEHLFMCLLLFCIFSKVSVEIFCSLSHFLKRQTVFKRPERWD